MAAKEPRIVRPSERPVLGWREWVALPQLAIGAIKAKVDTGARSSSLHAYDVEIVGRAGRRRVRFKVHPIQRDSRYTVETEAPLIDERVVRSSSGKAEERPVVRTELLIAGERWPIELTLTRRDLMGFRMLVGREAVRRRFLVDPGRSFLLGKDPKRRRKKKVKKIKKVKKVKKKKRVARRRPGADER